MRLTIKLLLFLLAPVLAAQVSTFQVRRIYNITSSITCIDNRSTTPGFGLNNYHAFIASGPGSWSAQMQYSETSCAGPWTSYGANGFINQASNPPIGYGNDGFNVYHKFLSRRED
jgi:hypothetical protein